MFDLPSLQEAVKAFGPVAGCLLAFLLGLNRRWWHLDVEVQTLTADLNRMVADRDAWRTKAEALAAEEHRQLTERLLRLEVEKSAWERQQERNRGGM